MRKRITILASFMLLAMLATAGTASAIFCGDIEVHAVDNNGNDLQGVLTAPEWKTRFTGWNDAFPKDSLTDSNGIASENTWVSPRRVTWQVNYATLEGYTCTRGESTRIRAACGLNTLETVCTPNQTIDVPEFGVLAAIGILAAAGLFIYKKRQ